MRSSSTPLDKYRTIRAAEDIGFPCPKTYLAESQDDLRKIVNEIGFPLVLKLRFTSGGRGFGIVRDFAELSQKARLAMERRQTLMIQEYIPGDAAQSISLVVDQKGKLKVAAAIKNHRNFFRTPQNFSTAAESIDPYPQAISALRLVRHLSWWWGCVNLQMKIDPRDGIAKLMEINPRLGSRRWSRTESGINEALMCVKIVRGEKFAAAEPFPAGIMLIHPIEDLLGLGFKLPDLFIYKFRIGVLGSAPLEPSNPPMALKSLIHSYKETYLSGKKKISNPYFQHFFETR